MMIDDDHVGYEDYDDSDDDDNGAGDGDDDEDDDEDDDGSDEDDNDDGSDDIDYDDDDPFIILHLLTAFHLGISMSGFMCVSSIAASWL